VLIGDDSDELERQPVKVRRIVFPSQHDQIRFLRAMVDRYRGHQLIREKAIDIVFREAKCPPKAKLCHAVAIARWVQKNITYVNEGVETFQSPVRTLTWRRGDCDDFATVEAALCESIGIPCELVGLHWRGQFRHIFARAVIPVPGHGVRRIPLDATLNRDVRDLPNPIAISIRRGDNPSVFALL